MWGVAFGSCDAFALGFGFGFGFVRVCVMRVFCGKVFEGEERERRSSRFVSERERNRDIN